MSKGFRTRVQFPPVPPNRKSTHAVLFLFGGIGSLLNPSRINALNNQSSTFLLCSYKVSARCGCTYEPKSASSLLVSGEAKYIREAKFPPSAPCFVALSRSQSLYFSLCRQFFANNLTFLGYCDIIAVKIRI